MQHICENCKNSSMLNMSSICICRLGWDIYTDCQVTCAYDYFEQDYKYADEWESKLDVLWDDE